MHQTREKAFEFIGTGAFAGSAGQLRYEQISGNCVSGDFNGDSVADFMVRLDGAHNADRRRLHPLGVGAGWKSKARF